jgi:hypothetical protein
MNLPLNLSLDPSGAESVKHSRLVASDARYKTAQFWHPAVKRLFDPVI